MELGFGLIPSLHPNAGERSMNMNIFRSESVGMLPRCQGLVIMMQCEMDLGFSQPGFETIRIQGDG